MIQFIGATKPIANELTWNSEACIWEGTLSVDINDVSFAPELNLGGKYIYGASEGGWTPVKPGYYRITFYIPATGSSVDLTAASIGNYIDNETGISPQ
jgi:hypothetical protein